MQSTDDAIRATRALIFSRLLVGGLALSCCIEAARAEEPGPGAIPARIERLSDSEVDSRLAYLVERLDARRDYAWWWWNGWTAFYATGVVVEGTRAGLAGGGATRADEIIGAVKATGGVLYLLLYPLHAKDGADAVRALPGTSSDDRRRQLVVAEEELKANADASRRRYSWVRHALIVGINAAGAVIVWKGFDDVSRGWRSAGIGMAVGEVELWSQPWWPAEDWEEYQHRFNTDDQRISWHIVPTVGGAAIQLKF
jgi:hypothetical protein